MTFSRRKALWATTLIAVPLAAACGVLFMGTPGLSNEPSSPQEGAADGAGRPLPRVRTEVVAPAPQTRRLRFGGVTRAPDAAALSFTIGGRMVKRTVKVGDKVQPGDVLAVLDKRPLRNALNAAGATSRQVRAQLSQQRRDRDRVERLRAADAASAEEAERVQSGVQALSASLSATRAQVAENRRLLAEATLTAPFEGVITQVLLEPGEFAGPGQPVLMISGDQGLEVELEVPEGVIAHIEPGLQAEASFPLARLDPVAGKITAASEASQLIGRLFPVVVSLPRAEGLRPGMTTWVSFELPNDARLAVSTSAVIDPTGGAPALLKVVQERVEVVPIQIHALSSGQFWVDSSAVSPGDEIVVTGQSGLQAGQQVEVAR